MQPPAAPSPPHPTAHLPGQLWPPLSPHLTVEINVPTEQQSPSEVVGAEESGDLSAVVVLALHTEG